MRLIAPSVLSADFLHLEQDILMLNEHADLIHLDVMDGSLVPNISFGFSVIAPIGKIASIPMDAHLMIVNPDKYFGTCADCGVEMVSFHLEAARLAGKEPSEWVERIHSLGMKAGIAINPDVPVEELFPYLKELDYVLIMTVFAGFGGQKFIEESYLRIENVRKEIDRQNAKCLIQIDGGATKANASAIFTAGADILVAGSAVFKDVDPAGAIRTLRQA